ncbi:MAG: 5-formyltetrahydrofolate cyclo-ligase [Gammaproteobacteria bacterium]|nr:5-formyltetrahydrofolate cyclo-ligase [Gammaproteobacteria bacterium]MDH3447687.1 5-formyltetrahydrofolate cyclo-ligase [Gammaproteobacteria bacterium]
MESHDDLRQRNRKRRAALASERLDAAAQLLAAKLLALPEYRQARRIAAYFAVNGEIALTPVIDRALAEGKQVYLPNLDRQALRFSPYFHAQKMRINRFRLPEPDVDDSEMLAPADLDLVLAPLVVFDADCNRIGMGGGYYDRSFAFRKIPGNSRPRLIGVAHEMQKVDRIEPEEWDVRLDMVVTDQAIYQNSGTDL